MTRKLTREEFIAQFPLEVTSFGNITPVYDQTIEGIEVYRALNIIVIKVDGKFYCSESAIKRD
jgi:hypothetical protein